MRGRGMKRVLAGMLVAGSILCLCGCGRADNRSEEQENRYAVLKGKKITFLTSRNKYFNEYGLMAAAVREQYGCDVEFQVVPDNEYASFLKLKLATTEVPDVFEYNCPTQNKELEAARYCTDLSREAWVPRLVNADIARDPQDNKLYAMPKESASGYIAVYYNRAVMEQCGIIDPHPKTYQEFIELLETVKQKSSGIVPLYMTNGDAWTTQIFMAGGYPVALGEEAEKIFQRLARNELKWTEVPEFAEILTLYQKLIEKGYVNEDQATARYEAAKKMLGTGKAAMYLTTEVFASDTEAKYPGCKLGAFALPYADRDTLPVSKSVGGLFVPKEGGQVDVTKVFLEVWSLLEIQNIYFFRQGSFTAFTDTQGGKRIDCLQRLTEEYVDKGNYVYQMNDQLPEYNAIYEELWREYVKVAGGEIMPREALENFQSKYKDFLEKQGKWKEEGFSGTEGKSG